MRLCLISDVHGRWNKLQIPQCDVLISAGDYSWQGEKHMVEDFHKWMSKQPAKHFISVQGNHEKWVEANFDEAKVIAENECPGVHFIDEGEIVIDGVKFYGSAITPQFHNWAWNRVRGDEIAPHWARIPNDTQVLITHGPPHKILDVCRGGTVYEENVGCWDLLQRVKEVKPKLHIFGHIHSQWGIHVENGTTFINASICDEMYSASHLPILVSI